MRTRLLLPALLLLSTPAVAQVTIDQRALDPLQPQTASPPGQTPPKPATKPPARPTTARPAPARPSTNTTQSKTTQAKPVPASTATNHGTTVRTNPAPPTVPLTPPPNLTLPPPIVVPTRPVQPAAPAIITADAPGEVMPLQGGVRVTFGVGRADLNPATEAAIRAVVHGAPGVPAAPEGATYSITTFAAGTPEDPSTPRRTSLSRALTVRSVLISQGIPSVQIFVRALGPASMGFADGPPERADLTVSAPPPSATTAASPPATPATKTN
jgi:outer membrane protein OmpA-like peptidoglycan-associated protein